MEQIEAERTLTCLQALIERYSEIPDLTTRVSDQIEFLMKAQRHVVSQMMTFEAVADKPMPLDLAPPAAEAEKPWYPDDSGEWVECSGDRPAWLSDDTIVQIVSTVERKERCIYDTFGGVGVARQFAWPNVVAYKVIKS